MNRPEVQFQDIICVECNGELEFAKYRATCKRCSKQYQIQNSVFVCMPEQASVMSMKNEIQNIIEKDTEKMGSASEEIYEDIAKKYPETVIVFKNIEGLLRREFIIKNFLSKHEGLLLDFGCNDGHYLFLYKKGKQYGIDIAKSFLDTIALEHPETICIQNNGKKLPFKDNYFDLILCTEVLEHIDFPIELLKEFYRVLKINGRICVTTPNHFNDRNAYVDWGDIYKQFGIKIDRLYHTSYKPYELKILFEEAGFLAEEFGTIEKEAIIFNRFRGLLSKFLRKETNIYRLLALNREINLNEHTLDEKIFYSKFWKVFCFLLKWIARVMRIEGQRSFIIAKK